LDLQIKLEYPRLAHDDRFVGFAFHLLIPLQIPQASIS
jgi:hypothetical protein